MVANGCPKHSAMYVHSCEMTFSPFTFSLFVISLLTTGSHIAVSMSGVQSQSCISLYTICSSQPWDIQYKPTVFQTVKVMQFKTSTDTLANTCLYLCRLTQNSRLKLIFYFTELIPQTHFTTHTSSISTTSSLINLPVLFASQCQYCIKLNNEKNSWVQVCLWKGRVLKFLQMS